MNHEYSEFTTEQDTNSIELIKGDKNSSRSPQCRYCGGYNIKKCGHNKNGKQAYYCSLCKRRFVLNPEWEELEESDNVWKASTLGLDTPPHTNLGGIFNFNRIQEIWVREILKKYIYYASSTKKYTTLKSHFEFSVNFSSFLDSTKNIRTIEDVDRIAIIDFILYLKRRELSPQTRNKHLSFLSTLFEAGEINHWFKVQPYLIRKEDFVKNKKPLPRYIPEEVMRQLNQYLDTLPEPIKQELINPELDKDLNLQWLKKKITAETLSNGYCGLPTQFKCGKGNACLSCGDFRTTIEFLDQHKEHLERTKNLIEITADKGWERQTQVNKEVAGNLEKIIKSLEDDIDE